MIALSFLAMLVLIIAAGATQFWLLAWIGVGIFLLTLLMYLMALNDVFSAIVIIVVAIGAPILYLNTAQSWILYVAYIALGLWLNSGTISNNDVFIEWTFEGKVYEFFDEHATDALINLFSFIYAAIWGGLAYLGTQFHWFMILPTLYLVARSVIVLVKSGDYSLSHSFMLFEDFGNSFKSFGSGIKSFFSGSGYSERHFSWWNLLAPLMLVLLTVGLVFLESGNLYSTFAKGLSDGELFASTKWFFCTSSIWNYISVACESLSDSLPFFGDLLNIPLAIILFAATVVVAVIEVVLSLIWVIICLIIDEIVPFIIGFLLLYIIPALLPIGMIVLLILSFSLNHSIFNRAWNILCMLAIAIGCYYYITYMIGATPIVALPF